jgi:hypothetical protein
MNPGYFLAMSYGAAAVAIFAEIIALRVGRARALRRIEEERDLETQD